MLVAQPQDVLISQAVVIDDLRSPLKLITNHAPPKLGSHEILVENKAVGLNPIDWKCKKYNFGIYSFPWINGRESSGVVAKTGSEVLGFRVGDRVIVSSTSYRDNRTSTFQKFTAIDHRLVWKLPETFTFEQGASIGVGLVTASSIFYDSFALNFDHSADGHILVWGGTTVVGLYLIQLAKLHNLKVIAVASLEHEEYLKELGADEVIDRHQPPPEIKKHITDNFSDVRYGVDCISESTSITLLEILSHYENTKFSGIVRVPKTIPSNVDKRDVQIKKFHENVQFGKQVVDFTSGYLANGEIKPVRTKQFEGGLRSIEKALLELEVVGAKGEKYVVTV